MASEADQVLAYLATNAGRAIKAGWIEKQPVDNRHLFWRWNKKWFELYPHLVVWYNEPNREARGYLMLAPTTTADEVAGKTPAIDILSASGRRLRFRSAGGDAGELQRWFAAVSKVLGERRRELAQQPAPPIAPSVRHSTAPQPSARASVSAVANAPRSVSVGAIPAGGISGGGSRASQRYGFGATVEEEEWDEPPPTAPPRVPAPAPADPFGGWDYASHASPPPPIVRGPCLRCDGKGAGGDAVRVARARGWDELPRPSAARKPPRCPG